MSEEFYIAGKNAVMEALKADENIDKLYVANGIGGHFIEEILALARDKGIPVQRVNKKKLDDICPGKHQGIVAKAPPYKYKSVEDILKEARDKGEEPFVIVLDSIQDPQNLGSVLRTADACGVHGVIIPKNRAVGITPAVVKASAGAIEYVPVAKVTNIARTLNELKQAGLWIIGADMNGPVDYCDADLKGPIGLVVGSEGMGMRRLVKESCDVLVKIPMVGSINSLNASVAAAILMYEVFRQRKH
ncbi:23S rRNA (guanosine(2251)-2'-O)-methyltransferase RlmB [Caldanaerobius polysaccharolyticus]|uniref:23S rRNA (guanosine(2251)-2'-O)-methyltransferase RlmB n=1 Tax=Caldanaerobius polysaccharolyticus TaxID=44256 RepID=UPI00047DBC26|nr:23S rRNA (guanosine(2251)-2'-O)-methyltransferase RlmB [Caldanaerobius polysaccharolyticus]